MAKKKLVASEEEVKQPENVDAPASNDPVEKSKAPKVSSDKLERAEARGKFVLFRAGDGYVIKNHMDQLITSGASFDEGRKVLADMTRGQS